MPETTPKNKPLIFKVVSKPSSVPTVTKRAAFLIEDKWDDWAKFQTQFHLIVFDDAGSRYEGDVKIGQFGLKPAPTISKGHRRPKLAKEFKELDEGFFSLGQDDSYYETLGKLGDELRDLILASLRDLAADPALWERARKEEVTLESLLRSVKRRSVEGQFRRLAHGGARLTAYRLTYTPPDQVGVEHPFILTFEVVPESCPSTNIHVLIGPNGVGKTHMLHKMTMALRGGYQIGKTGLFSAGWPGQPASTSTDSSTYVANLVSVSFSAFDDFELVPEKRKVKQGIQYSYIGLRRTSNTGQGRGTPKSTEMLVREFVKSVKQCLKGARAKRWKRSLQALEADSIFKAADVIALTEYQLGSKDLDKDASAKFRGLSAGHRIVLLTITKLVETVEEQTLILFDEPEAHLHPPLLSAFVRALSELLINRNGLAIIATHSPVVLQEVPKTCVWMLQRTGTEAKAERPQSETFGENVGVLTREVFALEVTQSGFHRLLSDAVITEHSFESAVESFNNELGGEARAILRALFVTKERQS